MREGERSMASAVARRVPRWPPSRSCSPNRRPPVSPWPTTRSARPPSAACTTPRARRSAATTTTTTPAARAAASTTMPTPGTAAVLATPTSSHWVCVLAFPASFPVVVTSADVLDPFGAPTSLSRLLALMEDAVAGSGSKTASPRHGWWVAKEDDDAVYLKVPMPGLGKEHVKVWAEQNSLVIKGEGEKDAWDGDDADAAVPRYSRRIEVPADAYKLDKIEAEMKTGVLRVTLPKFKKEERKDVFQVTI